MKKPTNIKVDNGSCTLQINNNKIIKLNKHSSINIKNDSNITIELNKGELIGKVIKNENQKIKKLLLVSNNLKYEILGTIFYLKNSNKTVEFKLKEGVVKTITPKGSKIISANQKVIIKNNDVKYAPLSTEDYNIFKEIILIKPINFSNSKKEKINFLALKNKTYSQIFCINNTIITSDIKGNIYKIDAKSKKIVWKQTIEENTNSFPLLLEKTIIISSTDQYLYSLDMKNGKINWKTKIGALRFSTPQANENYIYACTTDGKLFCIAHDTGQIMWNTPIDKTGFFSYPMIHHNNIYIGGLTGNFYSFNLKTQENNWVFATDNKIISSFPSIHENSIYFGSSDNHIYSIDMRNGSLIWKYKSDTEFFMSPKIIDDIIFFTSYTGVVYSISSKTGEVKWKYETNKKIILSPQIIDEKLIYVATNDNILILDLWGNLLNRISINNIGYNKKIKSFCTDSKNNIILTTGDNNIYFLKP